MLQKTPKGQPSTAEAVLQELAATYDLPRLILDYRSLTKLKSTYTDKLPAQINPATGRVHTSYHQAVAATGRLSSSDPNLQNIPVRTEEGRRIRQAFIASRDTGCSPPTTPRSSCASWRICRATRACAAPSSTARTSIAPPPPRCSACRPRRSPPTSAAPPRPSTSA